MSKQKHYSGALSRRLLLRYAASLAAVAGTVLLLAAFAVLFLGNFGFWRRTAVLRQLVYWCRDYFLLLFILCTLGGWLAVTARFFQIPLRYLDALAEELAQHEVVIATEVGGGVVPVDPDERAAREAAGRLGCLLAQRAERVVRVFCGLPVVLK